VEAAQAELARFEQGLWGQRYAPIAQAWRNAWDRVIIETVNNFVFWAI
jgi:transposase-like protein